MKSVVVNRNEALKILKHNRSEHHDIFLEALDGYKKEALKQLEGHIEDIRAGKVKQVFIHMPAPAEHTKDYDRAIKMLEMSVNENIELDERTFQQFIMDDWTWKQEFIASNSFYSSKAALLKE